MVVVDKSGGVSVGGNKEILEVLEKTDAKGSFIRTWQNFAIFYLNGHYAIMDEDRNTLYYIAHDIEDAYNFLVYSRNIKSIETSNGNSYEIIDDIDHYTIRIYDDLYDGLIHIVKTEAEAMQFIEEREKSLFGKFEIVSIEEEVNIP
jgi:hypothetical protein